MNIRWRRVCVVLCLGTVLATLTVQSALAADGKFYLKFEGGPSWVPGVVAKEFQGEYLDEDVTFELDTGTRFDVVFGINLNRIVAIELETGVLHNSFEGTSEDSFWQVPILINGIFTLLPDSKIHPFAGIGGGFLASITPSMVDSDCYTGAVQFQAGAKYDFSERLDLNLGYKYLVAFRQSRFLGDFTVDYVHNHSLLVGLGVHF